MHIDFFKEEKCSFKENEVCLVQEMPNEFKSPTTTMVRWATLLSSIWINQINLHILTYENVNLITLCMLM
jgi:hypothetical protein